MRNVARFTFLSLFSLCISCKTTEQEECVDPEKVNPDALCTMQYDPVCGCDGETYSNACEAENAGVITYTKGVCKEEI